MENLRLLIRKVLEERSLRDWVKEKWVRIDSDGDIAGACGTSKNKQRPDRCLPKPKHNHYLNLKEQQLHRKRKKHLHKLLQILKKQELQKYYKS